MNRLYLFYVESNFHLLLAQSYISYIGLAKEEVYFVTHRGVKLPEDYEDRKLYDGTESRFGERIRLYRQNKRDYNTIFKEKEVYSFIPFQFRFPICHYYSHYSFIEEGFSAYASRMLPASWKEKIYELSKALVIDLLFPFAKKNIKGFLMGISPSLTYSKKKYDVIVSNSNTYLSYVYSSLLNKIVVPIKNKEKKNNGIKDSYILIMDRLNPHGRPFNDITYLMVLKSVLIDLGLTTKILFVKLHPSDFRFTGIVDRVKAYFDEVGIKVQIINVNLEELAKENAGNIFIGTNSTILYYAPILGSSNKSISFARQLANADRQYQVFLSDWGGVEEFCDVFSQQVKCL